MPTTRPVVNLPAWTVRFMEEKKAWKAKQQQTDFKRAVESSSRPLEPAHKADMSAVYANNDTMVNNAQIIYFENGQKTTLKANRKILVDLSRFAAERLPRLKTGHDIVSLEMNGTFESQALQIVYNWMCKVHQKHPNANTTNPPIRTQSIGNPDTIPLEKVVAVYKVVIALGIKVKVAERELKEWTLDYMTLQYTRTLSLAEIDLVWSTFKDYTSAPGIISRLVNHMLDCMPNYDTTELQELSQKIDENYPELSKKLDEFSHSHRQRQAALVRKAKREAWNAKQAKKVSLQKRKAREDERIALAKDGQGTVDEHLATSIIKKGGWDGKFYAGKTFSRQDASQYGPCA